MIYHNYSYAQLEAMADELNRKHDEKRLTIPGQVDVYDIVDLLRARVAFEYLTPDRTYLGATLFRPGTLYVWPGNPYKPGMMPKKKLFYGGTIIIDRDLNEGCTEQDHFTENFTVIHECFHFAKHQASFEDSVHMSRFFTSYGSFQVDKSSAIYKIERQANYSAAAFLMPREATIAAAREYINYRDRRLPFGYNIKPAIKEMGRIFGVNYSPMLFRLQEMNIVDWDFNPYL